MVKNTDEKVYTSQAPARLMTGVPATDPTADFIGSSVEYGYWDTQRVLPQAIDDAERLYGLEIYERMGNDPIIAAIDRVLKVLVLADGLSIVPCVSRPGKSATLAQVAEYEQAVYYKDYVSYCVSRLEEYDNPLEETLVDLLNGPKLGHQLAEVTYEWLGRGAFAGKAGLRSIDCKPRRNYAFAVDPWNKLVGIIGVIPGVSPVLWTGIVQDVSQFNNCIAPEKVLLFSLETRNRNPQGVSWYRGMYDPWQRKQTQKKNTVNAGTQTGGGLVTAIAPAYQKGLLFWDPVLRKEVTQTEAIYNALRHLGSGRPGVFPHETDIQVHQPPSANNYFDWFFDYCDKEMVTSFLLSGRAILEARHGSKADSGSAQDTLDELKMFVRGRLCSLLTRLGRRLLRLSFGDEVAEKYCPKFVMQRASRPDFAANATAIGALVSGLSSAGCVLAPNEMAYFLQEVLGGPTPEGEADALDVE